jgi:hypothetical protein
LGVGYTIERTKNELRSFPRIYSLPSIDLFLFGLIPFNNKMQFRHQNFPYPNLNFTLISNKKQKAKKYQKFIDYTRTNKKWRAYC